MFSLHTKRRTIISVIILAMMMTPVTIFAIHKLSSVEDTFAYTIPEGYTAIVDQNFYNCVAGNFAESFPNEQIPDTGLTDEQLGKITSLYCSSEHIANAAGIEKMTALTSLHVGSNQLTSLDVSSNTALTRLNVYNNKLTSLNTSGAMALTWLDVSYNQLTSLDVSSNTALTELNVEHNKLTSLNTSGATALTKLNVYRNQLTSLDVSSNTALTGLGVHENKLTSLDVSHNTALTRLNVYNNKLTSLDVSHNTALTKLYVFNNQLTSLDVSHNTALTELDVRSNQLTSLDVSSNTELKELYVSSNHLTSLDVSSNTALTELDVRSNQLTSLDVPSNTALKGLEVGFNQLTSLDVSSNTALTELDVSSNKLTSLDVSHNTVLTKLNVRYNQLTSLDVSHNTALTELNVYNNQLTSLNTSGATALTWLDADYNQLTSLDVSSNTALTELNVSCQRFEDANNEYIYTLDSLDVSHNTALTKLNVRYNQLTSLDVSSNMALTELEVYRNQLTSLDVSSNIALTKLGADSNQLTSLDVSSNTALTELRVYGNQLTSLDVSHNTALTELSVHNNQLTSLDVSHNTALTRLNVYNNKLTSLDVSSNTALTELEADNILIIANTAIVSESPLTFDLSSLKFIGADNTIKSTDNYTYDSNNKMVTVSNPVGAGGYIQVSSSILNFTYKLQIMNNLTYDANGGTGAPAGTFCILNGSSSCTVTISSVAPTRSGYYFLGYADTADATTAQYASGSTITISELDNTIYAVWAPIYELSYDANGGTGAPNTIETCHPNATSGECADGVTVSNIKPTKVKFKFLGWGESADDNEAKYQGGTVIKLSKFLVIYAIYAPTYAVMLNANGGEYGSGAVTRLSCNPTTVNGSCNVTMPSNDGTNEPTRSGYTFLGYADTANAVTATHQPGDTITLSKDKTVYAVWKKLVNVYTNVSGAGGTVSDSQENLEEGSVVRVSFYPDEGYEVNTVTVNDAARIVSDNELNLTVGNEDIYVVVTFKVADNEPDEKTYTLDIDLNSGIGANIKAQKCTIVGSSCDVEIPTAVPTRSGYTFLGYADTANAVTATHQPGDTITLSKDKTIYAVWMEGKGEVIWQQNQEYAKGNDENIVVKIDYPSNDFNKLLIDNEEIEERYYTVIAGSTIITVDDEYLNSLSIGEHTLTAVYNGGISVNTNFTVTGTGASEDDENNSSNDEDNGIDNNSNNNSNNSNDDSSKDGESDNESNNSDNDDLAVPNTASNVGSDGKSSSVAPDTGRNTANSEGTTGVLLCVLPIVAIVLVYIAHVYKRNKTHRKFDW